MRYMLHFSIIMGISFLGELLNYLIPLPIPASIYGLVLMFTGLWTGIIPLEKVRTAASFLVDIMALMFIPAAVGLMESWGVLKGILLPVVVIMVVSTFVVMGATGAVTQAVVRREKARKGEEE